MHAPPPVPSVLEAPEGGLATPAGRLMSAIGSEIRAWEDGSRSDQDARDRIGLLVRAAMSIIASERGAQDA